MASKQLHQISSIVESLNARVLRLEKGVGVRAQDAGANKQLKTQGTLDKCKPSVARLGFSKDARHSDLQIFFDRITTGELENNGRWSFVQFINNGNEIVGSGKITPFHGPDVINDFYVRLAAPMRFEVFDDQRGVDFVVFEGTEEEVVDYLNERFPIAVHRESQKLRKFYDDVQSGKKKTNGKWRFFKFENNEIYGEDMNNSIHGDYPRSDYLEENNDFYIFPTWDRELQTELFTLVVKTKTSRGHWDETLEENASVRKIMHTLNEYFNDYSW